MYVLVKMGFCNHIVMTAENGDCWSSYIDKDDVDTLFEREKY